MHVPPPPPPLSLARAARLLRPLRASLNALNLALSQHNARSLSAAALVRVPSRDSKPRSRNSLPSGDDEYAEGRAPKKKKRRRAAGGAVGKVVHAASASRHPISSSSPFVGRIADFEDETESRRMSGGSTATAASTGSQRDSARGKTNARAAAEGEGGFDLVAHLKSHDYPPDIISKSIRLARALLNILELIYPHTGSRTALATTAKRRSSAAATSSTEAPPAPRTVASLGELCARQIGWAIEENVRLCVEEVAEAREDAEEEALERERAQRRRREDERSGRRSTRRDAQDEALGGGARAVNGEEDAGLFQDEWYEACPAHSIRFVLVEHAMCILLETFVEMPFDIVLAFFNVVLGAGALVEASRFVGPLCATALLAPQPTLNAHALSLHVLHATKHASTFFDTLENTLLQSSFADRLYYAPFLSLRHTHLSKSLPAPQLARSASHLAHLLALQVRVGHKMLSAVQDARDEGSKGGEGMMREVALKLAKEIAAAVPVLVKAGRRAEQRIKGMEELRAEVFGLVDEFAELLEEVVPLAAALELEALAKALDAREASQDKKEIIASALEHLAVLQSIMLEPPSSDSEGDTVAEGGTVDDLLGALPCLLRALTSADFFAISQALSQAGLTALEAALLERVLDAYDKLIDVKAVRGGQVVSMRAMEARLRLATRPGQQEIEHQTPARSYAHHQHRSASSAVVRGDAAATLAHSSLAGRNKVGAGRGREQQTPSKAHRPPISARRGDALMQVDESAEEESDALSVVEDEDEGEEEVSEDEETFSPVDLTLSALEESDDDDERQVPSSPSPSHQSTVSSDSLASGSDSAPDVNTDSDVEIVVVSPPRRSSARHLEPVLRPQQRRASMPTARSSTTQQPAASAKVFRGRKSEPVPASRRRLSAVGRGRRVIESLSEESSEDELLLA